MALDRDRLRELELRLARIANVEAASIRTGDSGEIEAVDIVAGYDGGIWLLREDEFLRLGSDGSHGWPTGSGPEDHLFEVAPEVTRGNAPPAGGLFLGLGQQCRHPCVKFGESGIVHRPPEGR